MEGEKESTWSVEVDGWKRGEGRVYLECRGRWMEGEKECTWSVEVDILESLNYEGIYPLLQYQELLVLG